MVALANIIIISLLSIKLRAKQNNAHGDYNYEDGFSTEVEVGGGGRGRMKKLTSVGFFFSKKLQMNLLHHQVMNL